MADWTVRGDRENNRLYMTLDGYFDSDDMDEVGEEAVEVSNGLDDGMEMIVDLSSFKPSDDGAEEALKRGQSAIGGQLDAVVRVTSESTVGQMQWDRATSDADYEIAKADSIEDSKELLNSR